MKKHWNQDQAPLIAIVDDDDSYRSSARMLVISFGFRAAAFASAKDLLNWPLLEDAACLIFDVFMPKVDGLALQRQLRRTHPGIPIIFVTAHASAEAERQATKAGAVAMLRKPVADGILFETIRQAVDFNSRTQPAITHELRSNRNPGTA